MSLVGTMATMAVQEPTFLILTALAAQPLHGYGLMQRVKELSDSRVHLRTGTLYGALERLMVEGLIAADREEIVDGRLRRYYRLSDDGAAALATEAERLQRNVDAARAGLHQRATRPARPGLTATFAV
jgi:DNA-binding PadR family transcriptional regulator